MVKNTENLIHPGAIIEDGAKIGANVRIGPYCIVGPEAVLGDNVTLKSHVVIDGRTKIGAGTTIYPFASIGTPPQDLKYHGEPSELIIGENNTIREHVTMNPGTEGGGMKTVVGNNGLFMVGVHIAHDCIVGDRVIMANNATLGGHVQVGDGALIGGLAAVHQFIRIGAHAVVGGMCGVAEDVIPYGRVKGERGWLAGLNLIGLERGGMDKTQVRVLQKAVNDLFAGEGNFTERLERIAAEHAGDSMIMEIVSFAQDKGKFGLCQPEQRRAA